MQIKYDNYKDYDRVENTFTLKSITCPAILIGDWIDSSLGQTVKCSIKVNKDCNSCIYFGIVAQDSNILTKQYCYESDKSYIFQSFGRFWVNGKRDKDGLDKYKNSTVTLTANMSNGTLKYVVDSKKSGVLTTNIRRGNNVGYKFVVGGAFQSDSITIYEYDGGTKEEQKVNIINDNKAENKRLKEMESKLVKAVENASRAQTENAELQKEILTLKEEQLRKINDLNKMVENLQNEKKEMEMENIELKKQIKSLKLKAINPNEYEKWSAKDITFWICSLDNGAYKQYEESMLTALNEENIDGACLPELDAGDIKTWGIKDFRQRKSVLNHIKSIVNKKQNAKKSFGQNNSFNEQEGTNPPTAYI